jgi:hypothetical protein
MLVAIQMSIHDLLMEKIINFHPRFKDRGWAAKHSGGNTQFEVLHVVYSLL